MGSEIMITHSRIAQFLRSLASETTAENLRTNYLLMGEAIQTIFQSTSPFWTEYESLGKRIKGGEDSPPIEDTLRDFKLLAAAANRYLNQIGPQLSVTAGDRNQQEITQLVDQAFYKSQPFHFAKWITIAGLIFIGAGSGTFAGFSLNLWDRTKEAQQKLDDADRKSDQIMKKIATDVEELEKKQQDAFEATQRAIQQKNAQYDSMVKDELDKARQVFDQNVTAASTIIEQQKNKVVSDVGAADSFIEAKKGEV